MSERSTSFSEIQCGDLVLNLERPQIMGILNLTDDSFFDGGKYNHGEKHIVRAESLVREGASIIDIGAASSKPGMALINAEEEWQILEKPLKELRNRFPSTLISVDTYNASLLERCADAGVNMINDVSGGSWNESMYEEISKFQMAYVMMHIQGTPVNMQDNPNYTSLIDEVMVYLEEGIRKLNDLGFKNIILDPGFGFGKTSAHNFELLAKMQQFLRLGYPILAGLSRKSMIFRSLDIGPKEALNGTTALNMLALQNGAHLLRVHDAKEARETIQLYTLYKEGEKAK